ncbi:restriction endonuclease [Candidatus Berkelbacteria bacterium RBG_13_40_8]|uniref:Restriction endonuclease n=1 Tax=Candidatus Berkelbacteria bacterium RBG_13_40_8 TaxID=1797467 RepID=A0A1F5DPN1_9BACT|nr:MAG: restriction endonuclease [Candidatus Berkelbacteria bacterium RBG_13_40_8]
MNYWTKLSIDYASQKSYLDDLFKVYPTIPEGIRDIDKKLWDEIEKNFEDKNNVQLLKNLLKFELFPIKDSYTAYLRRDKNSLERNPATVSRLCGRLYELGLKNIFEQCSEPKETNRQIGPLFRRWLKSGALGIKPVKSEKFLSNKENAILDAGDREMQAFAKQKLNYNRNKGLDFIGRFNNKFVIAEAKFLTDFGGHQNAQFSDAVDIFRYRNIKAERIAILDGVLYIKGKNKMYQALVKKYRNKNIMSALVLREFLYQL